MRCQVCGHDYGVTHNCTGAPSYLIEEEATPSPEGFAPLYYLRLAFNIVTWDDVSIRRASRDLKAGFYGAVFWAITSIVVLLFTVLPRLVRIPQLSGPAIAVGLAVGLIFGLCIMAILTFVQLGLCHLIAKWFFGGTGTLMGVMRPLLLGWFVNVLVLLPVIGLLASGIAWTAILMQVFEQVDGIGRLQAFAISAGVNVCFIALQVAMHMRH